MLTRIAPGYWCVALNSTYHITSDAFFRKESYAAHTSCDKHADSAKYRFVQGCKKRLMCFQSGMLRIQLADCLTSSCRPCVLTQRKSQHSKQRVKLRVLL